MLFIGLCGPILCTLLDVSYGKLGCPSLVEPESFGAVLRDHPRPHQVSIPGPDTSALNQPDICLQLSLCIAFKSNAVFFYLLLDSVKTKWNKTKPRKCKQVAILGWYCAKYFIWFVSTISTTVLWVSYCYHVLLFWDEDTDKDGIAGSSRPPSWGTDLWFKLSVSDPELHSKDILPRLFLITHFKT